MTALLYSWSRRQKAMTQLSAVLPGLKGVDVESVQKLVADRGWDGAAVLLGYVVDNYAHQKLAGRMLMYDLKAQAPGTTIARYLEAVEDLLDPRVVAFIRRHLAAVEEIACQAEIRDQRYDWSSANTMRRTYLLRRSLDSAVLETPVQMWMRVAASSFCHDEEYDLFLEAWAGLCAGYWIPSSPMMFNAGKKNGQKASCFLITVGDKIPSILREGVGDIGEISRRNGGLGVDVSRLRHSEISGGGMSAGLIPWIRIYNDTVRATDQGGKRKGAATIFCRTHHIDIFSFCELSLRSGDPNLRAHDVNTALWTSDLFWERVKRDDKWTLFCPAKTKDLNDVCGMEFERAYERYEKDASVPRTEVRARDLLRHITTIELKSSMPYILHADAANRKSNHRHLGYIRSSNLCLEIVEFSSKDEIAVCNLSSICLGRFVKKDRTFDYARLARVVRSVVRLLDGGIDNNAYPRGAKCRRCGYHPSRCETSNLRHRPLGIGVSGFGDVLNKMDIVAFDRNRPDYPSAEASALNKRIFACMYWNAMAQSIALAREKGPYPTFAGSPLSEGKFQFDLWREEFELLEGMGRSNPRIRTAADDIPIDPGEWSQESFAGIAPTWEALRAAVRKDGARNSLLLTCMPTASSSLVGRSTEATEIHQSNIYSRKLMNGAYPIVNRHLARDLAQIGLWTRDTTDLIQTDAGSVRLLTSFVRDNQNLYPNWTGDWERLELITLKYRTMWEVSQKVFLRLAAERGRYICQSQSTNIYIRDPSIEQLMALHLFTYALGLKTGMYYLRMEPGTEAVPTMVKPEIASFVKTSREDTCPIGCLSCQ